MANIDPYLEAIENAVYGEEVRSSIHDAIEAINDEYESAEEIIEQVIPNMIAEEFSAESTYAVGDFVVHGNTLYICNTAIVTAGEWDSSKWTATLITDELGGSGASGVHIFEFDEPASAGSVTNYDPEINYANIARYLDAGEEVILKGGVHFYFVDEYTSGDVYHNIVFKRFSTVGNRISSRVSLNRDLAAPIYSTFKVFTPSVSSSDKGKVLAVNSSGDWAAADIQSKIVPSYDSSLNYTAGTLIEYDGNYFIAKTTTTGTFDSSKWSAVDLRTLIDYTMSSIAPYYDTAQTYVAGDYVMYMGMLFQFQSATSGGDFPAGGNPQQINVASQLNSGGTRVNFGTTSYVNVTEAYYIEYPDYYFVCVNVTAAQNIPASTAILTDGPTLTNAQNVPITKAGNGIFSVEPAVFGTIRSFILRNAADNGDLIAFSGLIAK